MPTEKPKGYCKPQDVFNLLGILDRNTGKVLIPTNETYPTKAQIEERILAESDKFDSAVGDTWREKQMKNYHFDRSVEWHNTNTVWYGKPFETQLLSPIREWDTSKGDKLEVRTSNNNWTDISDQLNSTFYFDYNTGMIYIKRYGTKHENAFRITYRYGREEEPPYDIKDSVCRAVAIWVMETDWYRTKMGGGGDLSSKNETIKRWLEFYRDTVLFHRKGAQAISYLE